MIRQVLDGAMFGFAGGSFAALLTGHPIFAFGLASLAAVYFLLDGMDDRR